MQYFDNLVIAVAGLMEPVILAMLAVYLGFGVFPGLLGDLEYLSAYSLGFIMCILSIFGLTKNIIYSFPLSKDIWSDKDLSSTCHGSEYHGGCFIACSLSITIC